MSDNCDKNCGSCDSEKKSGCKVSSIKHKILVVSGKGGVGKSSMAVNIAAWLAMKGFKTGLLDVDIHGPSVPNLLDLSDSTVLKNEQDKIVPVSYNENLKVMSIGFLVANKTDALIWRGPAKHGIIQQFVTEVDWGGIGLPYCGLSAWHRG